MRLDKYRLAYLALAALFVIGAVELGLRLAGVGDRVEQVLPDARLGFRLNPAYPGHDRRGYRNPAVPPRADVVALGDSQTYGAHLPPEAAWPRQLAALGPRSVYNMAVGGYGPAHSLLLWEEAAALDPHIVIEAFYAGNDLYDAYELVHGRGQLPELRSADAGRAERIRQAEAVERLEQRVSRPYLMVPAPGRDAAPARPLAGLRDALGEHSRIYAILGEAVHRALRGARTDEERREDEWSAARAFAAARPEFCQLYDDGRARTVFTSEYRLAALDLDDPRIEEGLHISLQAIRRMHQLAAARKIRFIALLIPTKESAFGARAQPDAAPAYRRLLAAEARMWRAAKEFLRAEGIETLDALPTLQASLAAGRQPYPVSHDGHPNAQGQRAIAELLAAHLDAR